MPTVYGPFTKTASYYGPPVNKYGLRYVNYQSSRTWWRSKPVTLDPHPYTFYVNTSNGYCAADSWSYNPGINFSTTLRDQVFKQAYDRFKGAIDEPASLAVSLAERKQAMTMLEKRVMMLVKFTRALRRGRFGDAAKLLKAPPGFRPKAKTLGNQWLEYHFGWEPLINDIHDCVDVLQRGLPPFRVRGRAKGKLESTTGTDPVTYVSHTLRCQLNAYVSVSDPNLWRANQLGLVNPAVVAWELVPFSFVVDWFLPVGDFLSSFTDFVGLALTKSSTTWTVTHAYNLAYLPGSNPFPDQKRARFTMERVLGIASPPLVRNRWTGISPKRAATAVSLLLQQLR